MQVIETEEGDDEDKEQDRHIPRYHSGGHDHPSQGNVTLRRTTKPSPAKAGGFERTSMEFYSFVADNFAPFYSILVECTDRDAPFVLDGLLYIPLHEHYTDTHGYTENNFSAFAMLGRKFSPRIRGLHKQWIYKIDKGKDYRELTPLAGRNDHTIHMDWIVDQWDRMGHFYASLETGHAKASMAMKKLNSFSGKNHFYRANRELGRIFKTEHILAWMSDKTKRQMTRRGSSQR